MSTEKTEGVDQAIPKEGAGLTDDAPIVQGGEPTVPEVIVPNADAAPVEGEDMTFAQLARYTRELTGAQPGTPIGSPVGLAMNPPSPVVDTTIAPTTVSADLSAAPFDPKA